MNSRNSIRIRLQTLIYWSSVYVQCLMLNAAIKICTNRMLSDYVNFLKTQTHTHALFVVHGKWKCGQMSHTDWRAPSTTITYAYGEWFRERVDNSTFDTYHVHDMYVWIIVCCFFCADENTQTHSPTEWVCLSCVLYVFSDMPFDLCDMELMCGPLCVHLPGHLLTFLS